MKLNLGCGRNRIDGYVNVDREAGCDPDLIVDLEQVPWPWESGAVEEIRLAHALEHLGQETGIFLGIMREMHRVLQPNAQVHIWVPHPRSDAFIGDPTHVRPVTPAMLHLFSQKLNREWAEKGWANTPLGLYCGVDFDLLKIEYKLSRRWALDKLRGDLDDDAVEFAIETYFNVVDEIYMMLQKVGA